VTGTFVDERDSGLQRCRMTGRRSCQPTRKESFSSWKFDSNLRNLNGMPWPAVPSKQSCSYDACIARVDSPSNSKLRPSEKSFQIRASDEPPASREIEQRDPDRLSSREIGAEFLWPTTFLIPQTRATTHGSLANSDPQQVMPIPISTEGRNTFQDH